MIETLWTSDAKNADGVPYFKVKQTDKWYIFGERLGKDSLAFILYDKESQEFGLIHERKPPLGTDVFRTTAFGGSFDKDIEMADICIEEVKEEAGYTIQRGNLDYLGQVLVSTQMNQMCHLYLVDVTGLEAGERDLQEGEYGSKVVWMPLQRVLNLQDWKAPTIIVKAQVKELL